MGGAGEKSASTGDAGPAGLFNADSPLVTAVIPSPNHGERRDGRTIDTVILHYTGMETGKAACDWLCNPQSEVSCHYFIEEDGTILQLVPESRRAWHAGASHWAGDDDINSRSIGIEIVNPGPPEAAPAFADAQIDAVIGLCRDILSRNAIPQTRVLAHSDVAPGRKDDPGGKFPWDRLARAGVGRWVEPEPIGGGVFLQEGDRGQPVEALQAMLGHYGYGIAITGDYDARTRDVVTAFQRHFRPARIDGIADQSTVTTLYRLARG